MSTPRHGRTRKPPAARRAEILTAAVRIALGEGLDRITLRAVADSLDVRPGLVHHYFPAVEDLIVEAFRTAAATERSALFEATGTPLERMSRLLTSLTGPQAQAGHRLWSSARHISRSSAAMAMAVEELEELGRAQMTELIREGMGSGDFGDVDATATCVRIYMAIDGFGAYANSPLPFGHEAYEFFVADVAEWALDLARGTLRARASRGATGTTVERS